ncbi:MAG: hypothetical protein IKJ65_03875 [Clostridia bacterium]|nr:hypothetical protein [Clostridia bacterium]
MKFHFIGTGAADYPKHSDAPEKRRYTSTLVDGCLLIDGTDSIIDDIDLVKNVPAMIFTHSHADHFDKPFRDMVAPKECYSEKSWAAECEAKPLTPFVPFEAAGFQILPLPANHSTPRKDEQPLIYILEKAGERVLYATDGGWLLNGAYHAIKDGAPLDAAIFDGTVGDQLPNDWRVFEHNTLPMVRNMKKALVGAGLLKEKAPVIVTHLARTLHPDQKTLEENEKKLRDELIIAYDGMVFDTRK